MPRRILLLITDLEIGGTPTVVRELAIRLRRAAPEAHVEVACLAKWGPVADQLRAAGVEVTAFGVAHAWQLPSVVRRLRSLVRDHAIDTVFSFLVHANLVATLAARRLGEVRFFQSIQTTQPRPRWHWWLQGQEWFHEMADRIIVPSPSVVSAARERTGIRESKFVVIPNAIDPGDFETSPIPSADPRPYPIGFIGRLDPIKRVPLLLHAVKQLGDLVHLHIFGYGPERELIEREVATLGIGAHVTMHGAIARPSDALKQIGLLALPSLAEGFGLVLIEAMAAGVPVVATEAPGIIDVVMDGENGLLARGQTNDVVARDLAKQVARVVNDPALRNGLIAGGRSTVEQFYTWSNIIQQYINLIGTERSIQGGDVTNSTAGRDATA